MEEIDTMQLKGSKTETNLKAAFAGESQANRRYLYFAAKADVEGQNDVSAVFRSTAEGETGHAHGHLEYLEECGDPVTGLPFGATRANLQTAIADYIYEKLTGLPGVFATRIAYVVKSGNRYELQVADADGQNAQTALASDRKSTRLNSSHQKSSY